MSAADPIRSESDEVRPAGRPHHTTRDVVENPRTGETVEFVIESAELLVMNVMWPPSGHRSIRHAHPTMEECWEVVEGRAAFEIDGVIVDAGPGSRVLAPRGRPHLAWNPSDQPARLRIEMRPARRWAEFVRRLCSGEDARQLLDEHRDEIVLAPDPAASRQPP